MTRVPLRLVTLAGLAALAACSEGSPTIARVQPSSPRGPSVVTAFDCSVTLASNETRCMPSRPRGARADLLLGGAYVTMASRNAHYDGAQYFTYEVAIQNLIPQLIGTTDGVNPAPSGLRVFFVSGPTVTSGSGTVTVDPDGYGTFTASNQPYYEYDEILADSAQSAWKTWTFEMPPTVGTFAFTVFVDAPVQFPAGWITATPAPVSIGASSTQQLSAVSHNGVGAVVPGTSFSWSSANPSVATVSSSGLVTGIAAGQTDITVSDNAGRAGTVHVTVS